MFGTEQYGENLFSDTGYGTEKMAAALRATRDWYRENKHYDYTTAETTIMGKAIGHFIQVKPISNLPALHCSHKGTLIQTSYSCSWSGKLRLRSVWELQRTEAKLLSWASTFREGMLGGSIKQTWSHQCVFNQIDRKLTQLSSKQIYLRIKKKHTKASVIVSIYDSMNLGKY